MSDEITRRLDDILAEVKRTNGRVSGLESWRHEMDAWRNEHTGWSEQTLATINDRLDMITTRAAAEIEGAIGRALDARETASKVAKLQALEERFGADIESDLARWAAVERLFRSTASKVWLSLATLAAGAGAAAILERLF